MSDEEPICRIIAGPNGAGKTTFALDRAVCYGNADTQPIAIFTQWGSRREVAQPKMLNILETLRTHVRNG